VRASGGTDFHEASKGLVAAASQLLDEHPTFQLTVIMCSDGEVSKDNAMRGHSHWKEFVDSKYMAVHNTPPYVETIGISSNHDADVLSGFIVNDDCGNYVRCTDSKGIREAFENAQNATMGRTAIKLSIEFPLSVHDRTGMDQKRGAGSTKHNVIVTGDEFANNFWIEIDDLDDGMVGDETFCLTVNGQKAVIGIKEITDDQQCLYEAIDFYDCILKDMLHSLRNITDPHALRERAKEIEHTLKDEVIESFAQLTAEPVEKRKLQQKIRTMLMVDEEQKEQDMQALAEERAVLMKEYKKKQRVWKQHRIKVQPFQNTLSGLKKLLREIMVGQVRMQEIRQHILDLHFRKTHQKNINRLVLSDEQLADRQRKYDAIQAPKEEDCMDITDDTGSGCFLSTMTRRECVVDAEPLWICGRVNRSGGAAVSNPELIKIEYISSDLVSDSYFRMAVESAARGKDGQNQNANVTFCDSSRQRVNCRLFPIYCNLTHFKVSSPYFDEAAAHTLSGRVDIRAADWNLPSAVIGQMLCRHKLSYHNVRRLLFDVVPSIRILLENNSVHPFSLQTYDRESDLSQPKVPLSERRRCRLAEYLKTFRARTSAWVTTADVLYADRLLNMDLEVDHTFYLSILLQRLRAQFAAQIQNVSAAENHKTLIRVLVCGAGGVHDDGDDGKEDEHGNGLMFDAQRPSGWQQYGSIIEAPEIQPLEVGDDGKPETQYDPNEVKPSMKRMVETIVSTVDIKDMLQAKAFFDVLNRMGSDFKEETCEFEAFTKHKYSDYQHIPNDFNLLWAQLTEIGCEGDMVLILRAICAVSIVCHSNKQWQDNLHWFGDDALKQIFNDPQAVLTRIYHDEIESALCRQFAAQRKVRERKKASAKRFKMLFSSADPPQMDAEFWNKLLRIASQRKYWYPPGSRIRGRISVVGS